MNPVSPVLIALARRYQRSQAGRTGSATRDFIVDLESLLADVNATEGDARAVAETELRHAARIGLLTLIPLHARDPDSLYRIRFSPVDEARFHAHLGLTSPAGQRQQLANQFLNAAQLTVPGSWHISWTRWCQRLHDAALLGQAVEPFDRFPSPRNQELIELLPRLLSWQGESLVRFVSCVLCGDSKRLETLAPRDPAGSLRGTLGRILADLTEGRIQTLDDLGILPNPRFALIHGPLQLQFDHQTLDLGILHGPVRLALQDIQRAQSICTPATRCITIENETTFHELARLQSGDLLVQTSYPGSGTVTLLNRLPQNLAFHHFGDSDEAGFDILRVLRERTGRDIQSLHMQPGRQPAEQEALGRPTLRHWPYYPTPD